MSKRYGDPRKRKQAALDRALRAVKGGKNADGWYELVDAFLGKPGAYEVLCALNGKPVHVAGKIGSLVIVSVPAGTDPQSMLALRKALSQQHAQVLVITDDVKFFRARRVLDPELESRLDAEADRQADALRAPAPDGTPEEAGDGDGPLTHGPWDRGAEGEADPRSEAHPDEGSPRD